MSYNMWRVFVLFLICETPELGLCGVLVTPRNTAILVGQPLTLECRADNESQFLSWNYKSIYSNSLAETILVRNTIVQRNPKFRQFFPYLDEYGSVVLYANETTMYDAGVFSCGVESKGEVHLFSAEVIVITEPLCSTNLTTNENETLKTGDHIWMQCSVSFNGSIAPSMIWRRHFLHAASNNSEMVIADEIVSMNDSTVLSTLLFSIDKRHNGSYFVCEISFTSVFNKTEISREVAASNQLDFSYTWKSPVILIPAQEEVVDDMTTGSQSSTMLLDSQFTGQTTLDSFAVSITLAVAATILLLLLTVFAFGYFYFRGRRRRFSPTVAVQNVYV